jgi:hypothetical protein
MHTRFRTEAIENIEGAAPTGSRAAPPVVEINHRATGISG